MKDAVNAGCLCLSMLGGAVVSVLFFVNPLAHGEAANWHGIQTIFIGLALGGAAWKLYQSRRQLPPA